MGGQVIVALVPANMPNITYADGDEVPAHLTLAYAGDSESLSYGEKQVLQSCCDDISKSMGPIEANVIGRGTLGEDSEPIVIVEHPDLQHARNLLMQHPSARTTIARAATHPHWIPHVSTRDYSQPTVKFEKIGVWDGDDHYDCDLVGESRSFVAAFGFRAARLALCASLSITDDPNRARQLRYELASLSYIEGS